MDPLSITATCLSLTGTITKVSIVVAGFIRDVRGARSDLDAISRELLFLKTVLELIADDISDETNPSYPDTLKKQIAGIVSNCSQVVEGIESMLKKYEGSKLSKAAQWVVSGWDDVSKLRLSLEAHKSALEIALDMITLTLAKDIKRDTTEIRHETSAIKEDTAQILAQIVLLQRKLPPDLSGQNSHYLLDRYLENLTSYAETVCDPGDIEEFTDRESVSSKSSTSRSRPKKPHAAPHTTRNSQSKDEAGHGESLLSSTQESFERSTIPTHDTDMDNEVPRIIGLAISDYEIHLDDPFVDATEGNLPRLGVLNLAKPPEEEARLGSQTFLPHTYDPLEYGLAATTIPSPPVSQSSESQWKPYRESSSPGPPLRPSKLYYGDLVLDCAVPQKVLDRVAHVAPPERDEFSHTRYTSIKCSAEEFPYANYPVYLLRASVFVKPRPTEMLLAIKMPSGTNISASRQMRHLARTLRAIYASLVELTSNTGITNDWLGTWDASWRNIMVAIVVDDLTIADNTLAMLSNLGICVMSEDFLKFRLPPIDATMEPPVMRKYFPHVFQHEAHKARQYEYTTQLLYTLQNGHIDSLECIQPLQTILCGYKKDGQSNSDDWIKAYIRALNARSSITMESGSEINPEFILWTWKQRGDS